MNLRSDQNGAGSLSARCPIATSLTDPPPPTDGQVADFGRARGADVTATATATAAGGGFVGSFPWGAPESLESGVYSTQSDVYSFGCVLSLVPPW